MLGDYKPQEIEVKCKKYWEENNTYKFNKSSKKEVYSIDTPPPFTSGELHMGHVLSYSFFDFVARYKRMRGFEVFYPQGWDTQGFPTETKVEKKYGRLPPVEFREKCVEWTREFIARMKTQMIDLGFSPDWSYEYKTMDPEYHRKVQLSLIQMYEKKMVYRGEHPVFWCTKCSSAIAKAETEEIESQGVLNYIIFKGPKGEPLQIATTRPELMHACVAVMYNPEDSRYKHLEGKEIETALGKKVKVIPDKDVEKEFGTGLLMVCTFGDIQDVAWTHRYNFPIIEAIDEHGKLINAGEFNGIRIAEAKKKIIEKLKAEGKILKQEPLKQAVKVHDRCKTPIELKNSLQWFANIKAHKEEIKAMANKVEWIPSFGIHYLIDWADNVDWDWCISRHRIFGTPIPFYVCDKCGYNEPVEEKKLPFYVENAEKKACPKCKAQLVPEKTVCDCWVDSSITPLIIAGWPEKGFEKLYPISLRPQGVEIVRTWAFYTIYRSGVGLTGIPPWKTILLNGNVLAPDGKKMSKSLGNVISPQQLIEKYPMDAIRQWGALSGAMAKDRPFSYEDLNRSKSFCIKLWNASKFVEGAITDYKHSKRDPKLRTIDRWILSRLNQTIREFTEAMEKFEFHTALHSMHNFFWNDFCDNYLEYTKYRIYDSEDKEGAQFALYSVLFNSIKLLAPFMSYSTEEIYRTLFEEKESIHLSSWPEPLKIEELAEEENKKMLAFNKLVSEIRQYKATNRLPQNAVIESMELTSEEELGEELLLEIKRISKLTNLKIKIGKPK